MGLIPRLATQLTAVASIVVGLTIAQCVAAQSPAELERGRSLFRQALSMEVAGDWAGALSRLEQVARIKTTPQVRFHLARCKEHLGRLTEALGDYRLAEYEASQTNAVELGDIGQARQALELRVPKLVVTLSPDLAQASVELDGIALGETRLGKDIPVDPGEHQLLVRMPDGQSFVRSVSLAETAAEKVELNAPTGFVSVPTKTKVKAVPIEPAHRFETSRTSHTPTWAWVAGGVGAAGAISAAVFWYVRERAIDDLNNGCGADNVCPTSLKSTQTRGEQASIAAPVALGVGLVGLGLAAYGILAPEIKKGAPDSGLSSQLRWNVMCDQHLAGVHVAGAF